MQSSLLMNSKNIFKPDINTLTVLTDGDKEIGVVTFDLTKFYECKPESIRAPMSGRRAAVIDVSKVCVMESDNWQEYPTAYL